MDQSPERPGDLDRPGKKLPVVQGKTSIGSIDYNLAGVIAYVPLLFIDVIASVLWLYSEPKSNKFLRFHAIQSLLFFGVYMAVSILLGITTWILSFIPILNMLVVLTSGLHMLISFICIITKAIVMAQAYKGQMPMLPYIGAIADSNS